VAALGLAVAGPRTWAAFSATSSNPSNALTAATVGGTCPTTSTPLWLSGFEHGDMSTAGGGLFTTVASPTNISVTTGSVRSGTYGLDVNDSSATNVPSIEKDFSSSSTQVALRLYLRFPTLPGADIPQVVHLERSPHSNEIDVNYVSASKKLTLSVGGGSTVTGSTVLAANTWYRVELRADTRTGIQLADWRIDGTPQPALSLPANTTSFYGLRLGPTGVAGALAWRGQYDDVLVTGNANDYPLGAGKVLSLFPNATADFNSPGSPAAMRQQTDAFGSSTSVDSTSWQRLVDDPMDSSYKYFVYQTRADTTAYYTADFDDVAAGTCVVAAQVIAATSDQSSGPANGATYVLDGATTKLVYDGPMGGATEPLFWSLPIAGASGAFTATELNGLQVRIGHSNLATTNPHWEALRIEYATS